MKKAIISTAVAIVTAIALFLAYGFYQSSALTEIHINSRVTIDAELGEVFEKVSHLGNFPEWSPFLEEDPSQKYEVRGTDGEVGAQFHWEGQGGNDLGYQELEVIEDNRFIRSRCHIQKPFQATPTFSYTFTEGADGVTVSQDFNLESDRANAFFLWLFGAEGEMVKTNERGLELLKQATERT